MCARVHVHVHASFCSAPMLALLVLSSFDRKQKEEKGGHASKLWHSFFVKSRCKRSVRER